MEANDPKDQGNQNATDKLVEKSRLLREKSKQTNENLNKLKDQFDNMKEDLEKKHK